MICLNKKITAFYFLIFTLCYQLSSAQIHEPDFREVVLELPLINSDKTLHDALLGLVAMGGIHYEGYCEQMKCLMLTVNQDIYPDNLAILNTLKTLNTPVFIKPSGKIYMIKQACKDPIILNYESTADHLDSQQPH